MPFSSCTLSFLVSSCFQLGHDRCFDPQSNVPMEKPHRNRRHCLLLCLSLTQFCSEKPAHTVLSVRQWGPAISGRPTTTPVSLHARPTRRPTATRTIITDKLDVAYNYSSHYCLPTRTKTRGHTHSKDTFFCSVLNSTSIRGGAKKELPNNGPH